MANLAGYLICPNCQNTNQFTIQLPLKFHAQGANYLVPYAGFEVQWNGYVQLSISVPLHLPPNLPGAQRLLLYLK